MIWKSSLKNLETFKMLGYLDILRCFNGNNLQRYSLVIAMKNFETVCSAWDGEKLVGMVCAMDDGIMTAYVHYVLIRPDYQGMGIGKEMMKRVTDKYKDYLRIVVVSYNDEIEFYEHCGFEKADDASPMFITDLWT